MFMNVVGRLFYYLVYYVQCMFLIFIILLVIVVRINTVLIHIV